MQEFPSILQNLRKKNETEYFIKFSVFLANMTKIAFVGDVHGKIDLMQDRVISTDADIIIQVGDLGTFVSEEKMDKPTRKYDGMGDLIQYYTNKKRFLIPTYFIKGNHDDYEIIEEIKQNKIHNLHYLENSNVYEIAGLKIGVLGGSYSGKCYNLDKNDPELKGRRQRHFNHQAVEYILKQKNLDVIVGHEGPLGANIRVKFNQECGCDKITELIHEVQPKYYICGHYHTYAEALMRNTKIICLDEVTGKRKSIFLLET